MHKWKKIAIHAGAWIVWNFVVFSWAIFTQTPQPVVPIIYNVVSLILVFYGVRWMASKYWRKIEKKTRMYVGEKGLQIKYPGFGFYILQWPFFGVIGIVFAYIGVSWVAEGIFVESGYLKFRLPNFYYYTFSRWMVESFFVCAGNVMAAIEYHFRKQKEKDKAMDEAYNELSAQHKRFNDYLKNTISDLERQAMDYKHAKDELQKRLGRLPPGTGEY